MGKIELTPSELLNQSAEMNSLAGQYESLFSGVSSILNDVNANWSANLANNFGGKMKTAQSSFSNVTSMLKNGAEAARTSAENFQSIDSQLAKASEGYATDNIKATAVVSSTQTKLKSSWLDKLQKRISSGVHSINTGEAKAVNLFESAVSSVIENYKNKGCTWKFLKCGSAIAASIVAVTSAAAAWGMTAGSGGLGAPIASLVTVHSANTIANSFSDFYNCLLGDTEQVGEVNYLKSIDETILGKTWGDAVYNLGSIADAFFSVKALSGSLKQAPDMASAIKGAGSDLKAGAGGILGIAKDVFGGQTKLSHVKVQIDLLGKELTHLNDLNKCIGILEKVGKTTKKIGNSIFESVYGWTNPGDTYNSSITDLIFGENNSFSNIKEVYEGVKDVKDVFTPDTYSDLIDAYRADKIQYGNS